MLHLLEQGLVRSGALLAVLAQYPGRYITGDYAPVLDAVNSSDLKKGFMDIVAGSREDNEAVSGTGAPLGDVADVAIVLHRYRAVGRAQ